MDRETRGIFKTAFTTRDQISSVNMYIFREGWQEVCYIITIEQCVITIEGQGRQGQEERWEEFTFCLSTFLF